MIFPEVKIAKELKLQVKTLTEVEALQIAVGIRQNELFEKAHAISSNDKTPPALEAIAIQLGFKEEGKKSESITEIMAALYELLEERLPQS